ncbi:MAG: dienelactone hydrolase family protein [Kiritimatiellae bacterium]|nr:dienelactone hydrolase family protein [Kiritimatiellia bacterium]
MKAALYSEPPDAGNAFRAGMLAEVRALVRKRQRQAEVHRRAFFKPDFASPAAYAASLAGYRAELTAMLGWPLTERGGAGKPAAALEPVGSDALGGIWRVWVRTLPGLRTYGLYFRPHSRKRLPFVVALHGGGGTPELCSGFFGSANYNDMTRRVLRRGIAVFAPQLLLWNPERYGPKHEKDTVDRRLKQAGGSLAALELVRIRASLDYFAARRDVDPDRIGAIGLSYGGFYSLFAAALDTRIRAAVSSCFFNDRTTYDFADWVWFGAANRFLDAEVAALVCPRALYIEMGEKDDLFAVRRARPEAKKVARVYRRLGVNEAFRYREHEGGHELNRNDEGIDFLCRHLGRG